MTVGGSDSSSYPVLAEIRSNTTYTLVSVPDPGGASLSSISCTSTSACTAVGDYNNGTATVTLAERWNGSSWSVQTTPNPGGGTNTVLNRVACTSATSCIAVGDSYNGTVETSLAEAWNGSSWAIRTTPNVTGQTVNQLNGLACTAAADCTAVGYSGTNTGWSPLAEAWNGSSWSIQAVPSPGGSSFNPLNGISCTAATACTAVGYGFAERWNGTSWSVQAIARTKETLSSVSCVTATSCTAVGFYYKAAIETMAAETWNGTTWREVNPAISASYDSDGLSDVSCQNINACTAVGFYHNSVSGNRALVEIQQLRWHPEEAPVPSGAIATGLQTVSCPTAKACMAVGGYETSGSTFPDLIESWNGSTWTILSSPNASNSNLSGVSCTSATACTAVGDVSSGGSLLTLAERWNGTAWTVQSSPSPAGAVSSYLTSVSCSSATACTATGFYQDGSGSRLSLAETWNGSSWTIQSTPNPSGSTDTEFNSVSCTSATACIAVGTYLSPSYTMFAAAWNGTSWTLASLPSPSGSTTSVLQGVSCSAANACTAVGDYSAGGRVLTLAQRWNGTSWAVQATPNRIAAPDSYLSSISCTSATSCTATGSATQKSGTVRLSTLAERWNGTSWHMDAPGAPSGATHSDLTGVSCQSASACMGVGWYYDPAGNEFPLAAQYY
jgi:hypothetical protein